MKSIRKEEGREEETKGIKGERGEVEGVGWFERRKG